jgi:hypothetical protein
MSERPAYGYGTPNWEMITRWFALPPEEDTPFWALNLMKYKARADYGDGRKSELTGKQADDVYVPYGPLEAIGAMVVFGGDVADQRLGEPSWDRVGIVRYPSRSAFFAMQQRDDFKQQHVHKEAGMDFTIVMSCLPTAHDDADAGEGRVVLLVERGAAGEPATIDGVRELAAFTVEGVIVGDDRTFDRARFVRAADDAALAALVAAASASQEAQVLVVAPMVDRLIESIVTAPSSANG